MNCILAILNFAFELAIGRTKQTRRHWYWMRHISLWSVLMMLIYLMKTYLLKHVSSNSHYKGGWSRIKYWEK